MPLTDTQVANLKPKSKTYRKHDRDGLCIQVSPTGTKTWFYRFRLHGKEDMYRIGRYPEVGLKDARNELLIARELVEKKHINPKHHARQMKAQAAADASNTFQAVAEDWIEERAMEMAWSPRYRAQVEKVLKADVFPDLGSLPVKSITPAQVLEILDRIVERDAPRVARNVLTWSQMIFNHAITKLKAEANPAAPLSVKVPKTKSHRHLKREEIAAFLSGLETDVGKRVTKINLMLLLYLAPRPSELRLARWEEFDLDAAEWRVPEHRMKMKDHDHVVPLPEQAVALLRELKEITGKREYLFPNSRTPRKPMNDGTTNNVLRRLGLSDFSSHGFRSTMSTHLNEMGFDGDWIERQLAHTSRNQSRATYNNAVYKDQRRTMLQAWADFVDGLHDGSNVVPIKATA